jgi:hypothetical protein
MNSRDDPKDLKNGEVIELINAEPGNPPVPRKGMRHWKINDTEDFVYASHFVAFTTTGGNIYLVGWILDGTDYKLIKINYTTKIVTELGAASDLSDPAFKLIKVFDYIYSIIDEDMHWRGSSFSSRHKIIELLDAGDVIREMCIDVSAGASSVSTASGTVLGAGYVGYAFTFIRHTASDAFDSNDLAQILTTFTPGVNESYETASFRLVVGSGSGFDPTVNLVTDSDDTTYEQAVEFGATHIRIYRTRLKTTEALATAALAALEGYFLVDLPIPSYYPTRDIAGIGLDSNDYRMTITGHSLTATDTFFVGFDNVLLDGLIRAVTIDSVDVIRITGTWEEVWDDYVSGGYVSQDYALLSTPSGRSISMEDEKIKITVPIHGVSATDQIIIEGVEGISGSTGGDGSTAGEKYIYAEQRVNLGGIHDPGPWYPVYKQSAGWTGINGAIYTVDSVIDQNSFYLTTLSADYTRPFEPATTAELAALSVYPYEARAYTYTDLEKTPRMQNGYMGRSPEAVSSITTPNNEVIIETTLAHDLSDDLYVMLDELDDGSEELDGYSGLIEVIDTTHFKLVGKSTSGISAWVSGGIIYPSTTPLSWADTVTDDDLSGELASMVTTSYSAALKGGFIEYADERIWVFGLLDEEKGRAIYSEKIGGAGGTPLSDAVAYPQKFASMFKYNYFIDFSVKSGQLPTGMIRMSNDLYFFFEGEVYALFTSNPLISTPTLVNGEVGCAFPETLKLCDIPIYGGQCLLYLSNLGPAITRQGGETFLFNDFKIDQLWPKNNRELYEDLESVAGREHIIHNCSAVFFKNRYIITYETEDGTHKIFVYYFNPRTRENPNAPHGPYQIELAEV